MSTSVYDRITDRIVSLLEQGTVPWHQPWKAGSGLPRNLVSKKPYRGVNVFILIASGYESPLWLTYRQATELGGTVRQGEKACPVVFWKKHKAEEEEKERSRLLLRFYHVFNIAQCDGVKKMPILNSEEAIKPAAIVANMPQAPAIKFGMEQPYYSPTQDHVGMPSRERFDQEEEYYSVLFHELIHSTGHQKRLKRQTLMEHKGFGSDPYCKEELIAELGASFLCGHAEIVERTIDNSAAYLNCWLERLKNDRTLIVNAAAQAQRAADFILNVKYKEGEVTHD